MKTAVIYARVSSSNDRQDTSRQIEDLKKYAISQDIEIVNIFQEHISGAKRIEERQILGECLEYCKRESVNILLLSELSRLGRSTLQVLRSLDILHESKVSVYIQNLGLYTLQPNGEVNPIASIMVTVLAEMANIERSNIQYRLNSGRANYIAKGGKLGRKTGSTKTDDKKKEEYNDVSGISGIFKSFGDSPDGFKGELQEMMVSIGAEYSYNDQFFLRGGYFYENANKGNRQYFSVGAGFRMSVFQLDAAYLVSTVQSNPLDQTLRFSLSFDMDGIKNLFR